MVLVIVSIILVHSLFSSFAKYVIAGVRTCSPSVFSLFIIMPVRCTCLVPVVTEGMMLERES